MRVKKKNRSNNGSESDQNLYQKKKKKKKSCNFYKMEVPTRGKAHIIFFSKKKTMGKAVKHDTWLFHKCRLFLLKESHKREKGN